MPQANKGGWKTPSEGRCPMANVVKKHSISSELAQKMVDAAVAKAREIGVSENVAILDDGGNLKAFSRMDGAPILCIEIARIRGGAGGLIGDRGRRIHGWKEPL